MLLFINCCPRKDSRTKRIADALLKKKGEYQEINLYKTALLPMDEARLNTRNALLEQGRLDAEKFALARQFAAAEWR